MKRIQSLHRIILCTVLIAVAAPVVAQDKIPWITDLKQARDVAERQHRLVLLHFWSDDCVPCKQVERNVFNQPEFIRALTTGYVPVKINANQQPQLAEFYKIERVPTDVIVTPEGREVQRFQSLQDSNQYIAMLDGIRAQASVGAYVPVAPNAVPAVARPQEETARSTPYGSYTPTQPAQPQGGQNGYGQTAFNQTSPTPNSSPAPSYSQNRYANPLDQETAPQQQQLAPRYANPYGQDSATISNSTGSRYGQPTPGYDSNVANNTPSRVSPQANQFIAPEAGGGVAGQGSTPAWQQDRGAQQPGLTQNQGSYSPPQQNQTSAPPATSPGYGGGQTQPSAPPAQANPAQPQISLEGYCPVTLVQNRVWTPGDKKWGAVHEGRVYLFAGPEQQQQFLANPHVYAPLMAGYDPVRFAETGQLVPGRREFGLYIDEPGPIALFADEPSLERFHANSAYYFNVIRQAKMEQTGRVTR